MRVIFFKKLHEPKFNPHSWKFRQYVGSEGRMIMARHFLLAGATQFRNLIASSMLVAVLVASASFVNVVSSQAEVVVDIKKGNVEPLPIALSNFSGELGPEISSIIEANLRGSGLFRPIDQAAFIQKIEDHNVIPRFEDWRLISAQALVSGTVVKEADGRLKAEFRLWDVFGAEQMISAQYFTGPNNKRRLAHIISDAIYS